MDAEDHSEASTARGLGKWAQDGVPHKGWTCVDYDDLGAPLQTCEMCETMIIRYVHYMTHPEYPETLECGCICAGHMEENYQAAREREHGLRKKARQRTRYARSPRWSEWAPGGSEFIHQDLYRVLVFPTADKWRISLFNTVTNITTAGRKIYPTKEAAKFASFAAVQWCKDHGR